jgi:murein DD-endopeptidase MepM/ murein hydrolase activator NlpD
MKALVVGVLLTVHLAVTPPFPINFPQEPFTTTFDPSFGYPRRGHTHKGNDLMAPKMTPVFAAGPGTVETVTRQGTAGRYIKIDHGNGWTTLYMHLNNDDPGTDNGDASWEDTVTVEMGDTVEGGALIGYVGDSGNAEGTPSHTHFELRHNGRAIDPYSLLKDAQGRAIAEHIRLLIEAWEAAVLEAIS